MSLKGNGMTTLHKALEQFIDYCRHERCFSVHTTQNYQRDCQRFISYLNDQNKTHCKECRASDIQAFLMVHHQAGKSPRTLSRWLASLRSFFEYAQKHDWCDNNPAKTIKAPKAGKPLPKTLDVDQVLALLDKPSHEPLVARDMAIMELFYSSGLRLSELIDCDLNDFDFQSGTVRVTGKGKKTRIVPIGSTAIKQIRHWLSFRGAWAPLNEPAVFISEQGKRLSQRAVQKRLAQWGIKAGLETPLHPHKLRHSVASHLLESSGDLRAVQEFLGHANLATTQIYTQLDFQHLAKVYDETHPRARKKSQDSKK